MTRSAGRSRGIEPGSASGEPVTRRGRAISSDHLTSRRWDAGQIRDELEATLAQVPWPTCPIDELELPEWFGRHRPTVWPEHILLLDVDCFEIGPARCVLATTHSGSTRRFTTPPESSSCSNQCYWLLQLEVEEGDDVGEPEGAVAQRILNRTASADSPIDIFDPYDRQWDGIVPIER